MTRSDISATICVVFAILTAVSLILCGPTWFTWVLLGMVYGSMMATYSISESEKRGRQ